MSAQRIRIYTLISLGLHFPSTRSLYQTTHECLDCPRHHERHEASSLPRVFHVFPARTAAMWTRRARHRFLSGRTVSAERCQTPFLVKWLIQTRAQRPLRSMGSRGSCYRLPSLRSFWLQPAAAAAAGTVPRLQRSRLRRARLRASSTRPSVGPLLWHVRTSSGCGGSRRRCRRSPSAERPVRRRLASASPGEDRHQPVRRLRLGARDGGTRPWQPRPEPRHKLRLAPAG